MTANAVVGIKITGDKRESESRISWKRFEKAMF